MSSSPVIETNKSELGDNYTTMINERGVNVPRGEWAVVNVLWYVSHPECYRDLAIVKRIRTDFDPNFCPVVVKRVWQRPNGGHEPFYYHVLARKMSEPASNNLGAPLKFEDTIPEDYKGFIHEGDVLEEHSLMKDGRPSTPLPFDERVYAKMRNCKKALDKYTARQILMQIWDTQQAEKERMVKAITGEMEYRLQTDGQYVQRALTNAHVGWADMRVLHQPTKVMPGTELGTELSPSGLVLIKQ